MHGLSVRDEHAEQLECFQKLDLIVFPKNSLINFDKLRSSGDGQSS